jgi:hypothetical protein
MKFHQLSEVKGGKIFFDRDKMKHLIENLYEGQYLISFQRLSPKADVKEFRKCYFAKIDALAFEVGDTRYGVHELVKEYVIYP